jgi:hypothetical protein
LRETPVLAAEELDLQLREAGHIRLSQFYKSPFNGLELVVGRNR